MGFDMFKCLIPLLLLAAFAAPVGAVQRDYVMSIVVDDMPVPPDPPVEAVVTMYQQNADYKTAPIQIAANTIAIGRLGTFRWLMYDVEIPVRHVWFFVVSGTGHNDGIWDRVWDPNGPGTVEVYHSKQQSRARLNYQKTSYVRLRQWIVNE